MRAHRLWEPGAIYHIMNRGARKQAIFHDNIDRYFFLKVLREAKAKYGFKLHAYCLMPNHFHLLLETGDVAIWDIMKTISQRYTAYYNAKYCVDGALFRGRYKSILVEDDRYFLMVNRYICLNPVKANLAPSPEQYRWSSYQTYLGIKRNALVSTERTMRYFRGEDVGLFKKFVELPDRYEEDYQKVDADIWRQAGRPKNED